MTLNELVSALEAGMARDKHGLPLRDDDLVFTFCGPTARGLGVRVQVLAHLDSGQRLMGVDRKTAQRWVKKLRAPA